jgi:hypothetical protein
VLIAFAAGPLIDLLGPRHPIVAPVPVANPMTSCTYGDPGCGAAADAEAPRLLDLSDPPARPQLG